MHRIKLMGLGLIIVCAALLGLGSRFFGFIESPVAQAYSLPDERWLPSATFQTQPVILLNPISGSEGTPVTVSGQGWVSGEQVIIYLEADGQEFALANTMANETGQFSVSYFTPANWTDNNLFTIVARTVSGDAEAQTSFVFVDEGVPDTATTAESTASSGVVTVDRLNVRSGPGDEYSMVGWVSLNQTVEISGQNNGWWRIRFLYATGDYGWVSGLYIDADNTENVPFIEAPPAPAPAATSTPTATPQPAYECNPGEWSGCSPSFCPDEYVSQCGDDGTWGECVWDPGSCGSYDDDDDDDDDDYPLPPPIPTPLPQPQPTPLPQAQPQERR